jgi:hypothetical protein
LWHLSSYFCTVFDFEKFLLKFFAGRNINC